MIGMDERMVDPKVQRKENRMVDKRLMVRRMALRMVLSMVLRMVPQKNCQNILNKRVKKLYPFPRKN